MTTKTYHRKMQENFSAYPGALEIYEEFRTIGSMLNEAKISQNQVKQIFQAVADGYQKGDYKHNPELYGQDADKSKWYKKIYAAYDKVKNKIATSAPIRGFDVAFDKIQQDLLQASGGDEGKVGKALAKFREFGTKYPKVQSVIIYGLAAAAGAAGGVGVVGILASLRVLERLLKGDRLSTAVWNGIKTLGVGAASAGIADYLTPDTIVTPPPETVDAAVTPPPPIETVDAAIEYTVEKGDTLSDIAKENNVSVKDLMAANPDITHADQISAGETINIPNPTGSTVYDTGVGTAADTADKVEKGIYKNRPGFSESIVDFKKTKAMREIRESLHLPGDKVYLTAFGVSVLLKEAANLNEGIWDSIKGAFKSGKSAAKDPISYEMLDLYWKKNYKDQTAQGSVDSDEVVKFLTKMGVEKTVVDSAVDNVVSGGKQDQNDKPTPTPTPTPTPIDPKKKGEYTQGVSTSGEYQYTPGQYGYWDRHSRDMDGGKGASTSGNQATKPVQGTQQKTQSSKNDYTVVNNYVKNVSSAIKQAPSQDEKIKLVKELVNFMADRQGTPEWDNASGTVKQILKTSGINGNTIQNAIQRHQQGKMMESFQYMFITKLLKEMNMTFEQLGLVETIVETNNGKSFIVESIEDKHLSDIIRLTK